MLISIVLMTAIGAGLVAIGRDVGALGVAAAVTGLLVGVLGTFRPSKAGTAVGSAETENTGSPAPGQQTTTQGE